MPMAPPVPANIPIVPWPEENLGIWQLKDLNEPMSRADADGSRELVPNLELAEEAEGSASMASLGPLLKAAM